MDPLDAKSSPAPRFRRLTLGLSLSLLSLVVTGTLLEGLVRLAAPLPAPVTLHPGIFVSQMPLINGRQTVEGVSGAPLPTDKRPGEVRVFVFGESSVVGAPWGYIGSPPTFLHDQLAASLPESDITVVNMGRAASFMRDSLYYLATIERFSPDYVIFYQGMNEEFALDPELCLPALHPHLFSAWAGLLTHSRLVWTLRARVRPALLAMAPKTAEKRDRDTEVDQCDPQAAFRGWTERLVATATAAGARVIVTTPVVNAAGTADRGRWGEEKADDLGRKPTPYKRALRCALQPGCDVQAALAQEGLLTHAPDYAQMHVRERIWLETAAAHHVPSIVLREALQQYPDQADAPIYAEMVHLSLRGYWLLAYEWTKHLHAELRPAAPPLPPRAPPLPPRYQREVETTQHRSVACILLHCADDYLRFGRFMMGGSLLAQASHAGVADDTAVRVADLLRAWLARRVDATEAVAAEHARWLEPFSFALVSQDLAAHPDCSDFGKSPWAAALHAVPVRDKADVLPTLTMPQHEDSEAEFVIPPGQSEVISLMLDATQVAAAACAVTKIQVQGTRIVARYTCADGQTPTVTLQHPQHADPALMRTTKFAVDVAPLGALATWRDGLVAQLRQRESAFTWGTAHARASR